VSFTTHAISSGTDFPFITVPGFEVHGGLSNAQSKALQTSFVPLIRRVDRHAWEAYAKKNQGWINESLALEMDDMIVDAATATNQSDGRVTHVERHPMSPQIYRMDNVVSGAKITNLTDSTGFGEWDFAPVWQQSPAPHDASIINFDLFSHPTFASIFHGAWDEMKPVLSGVVDLTFLYQGAIEDDITHPHSFILDPIYPSFGTHQKNDLVGVLIAAMGWDKYFSSKFPSCLPC
jgi:CHASE domain